VNQGIRNRLTFGMQVVHIFNWTSGYCESRVSTR
jgi:hypothetical protein